MDYLLPAVFLVVFLVALAATAVLLHKNRHRRRTVQRLAPLLASMPLAFLSYLNSQPTLLAITFILIACGIVGLLRGRSSANSAA